MAAVARQDLGYLCSAASRGVGLRGVELRAFLSGTMGTYHGELKESDMNRNWKTHVKSMYGLITG